MKKKLRHIFVILLALIVLTVISCYVSVSFNASGRTYDNVDEIQPHVYGLLLGTSPFTAEGARNFYFENRIKAARSAAHSVLFALL